MLRSLSKKKSNCIHVHDEDRPETYKHLWHLANCFGLCLSHPDGSRNVEINFELMKLRNIIETRENDIEFNDIMFTLHKKGVWLNSDCGQLIYDDSDHSHSHWKLVSSLPLFHFKKLTDINETSYTEDILSEVVNEVLSELVAQFIIMYTFKMIETTWRDRAVRKNQRRILQQAKDSKVQTLGDAARITVGDEVRILTTSVDIEMLQSIMSGLETPIEVPSDQSEVSSRSSSPASFTSTLSEVPDNYQKPMRRGSLYDNNTFNYTHSFDAVLAKKDKIFSVVALALNRDGVFQNMLKDGVRVMIHFKKPNSPTRRVQRVMKWKSTQASNLDNDMLSVSSKKSNNTMLVNTLEFYRIDVGEVELKPENSIVIDDIVEIYNGAFTTVFNESLEHLHGNAFDTHYHAHERKEHEKRCFSLIGCESYFDMRNCVDVEIIPRNKQYIKVNMLTLHTFTKTTGIY